MSSKPLGHRSYGSIPHLGGSQMGAGDYAISPGQARIATEKPRDKKDVIVVQEKLDGSNVAVARIGDQIVPIIRAGHLAADANRFQHRLFAAWATHHQERFLDLLEDGERIAGEWLYMAHGIRYDLAARDLEPFVAFDIMRGHERLPWLTLKQRVGSALSTVFTFHAGEPHTVERALGALALHLGGLEYEGAVWRVEREGRVDFMAKYVKPDFVPGRWFHSDGTEVPNRFRSQDAELLTQLGYGLGERLKLN